jgi:aspartate-semialdehyde dehydrogenase
MKKYSIAIIGATGIVGATTLSILAERNFPVDKLFLLASGRSSGELRTFKGKSYVIEDLAEFDFSQTQLCFFCAGNDISAEYAPKAAKLGNVIFDKSSHYRYERDVPLVVPEVNAHQLATYQATRIIANPNCNTIPIAVALKPIYDRVGIARINVATYQSVSGSGKDAIAELTQQTKQTLDDQTPVPKVYPQQIAFNVLPHIDEFEANGYTREEMKIVWEMQKIYGDQTIAINPTTVRVPVYVGHSAAVHLETKDKITAAQATQLLKDFAGLEVIEGAFPYPTPLKDAAGNDSVYVGRIREDLSHPFGLNLWVVTDNLRKGASLNAIQTAELLIGQYL